MKRFLIFLSVLFLFCEFLSAGATSAKSAVLINGDTGEIIYSENADLRLPMASTTKIMTALILCESGNLEREITVTEEMVRVEGTSIGLRAGDTVSLHDLLYGMMLCSGNDSANAVSITIGGSIKGFAEIMNSKARELSLENTSFATPSGLDAENHFTSAFDLALITKEAFKYDDFKNAVSSESATVYFGNPPKKITLKNHNKLLSCYDDVVGVKTGFTKKSGRCLVSASKKDGKFVIAVTLNDKDDWNDHRKLLDMGLDAVKTVGYEKTNKNIDVIGGSCEKTKVCTVGSVFCVNKNAEIKNSTYLQSFLYAPVKKGETVGYNVILSDGKEIKREEIKAAKEIKIKKVKKLNIMIQNLFYILRSINEG